MVPNVGSIPRERPSRAGRFFSEGVLRALASMAAMCLCLALLTYVPLGEGSFAVIFLVLLACCWMGGLGASLVMSVALLAWLRVRDNGFDQLFTWTPREVFDAALVFMISAAVGWSGQSRRRAAVILREAAARQLEHSEERFRLLVEGTRDHAIFMLDPSGRIVSWNLGAQRISQYSADEIVGGHVSQFYTDDDVRAGKPERALQMAKDAGHFEEEGLRVRKDGTTYWSSVVITALRDPDGNLRGFSKVTRDVTEKRLAEENSRRLIREAAAREAAEQNARVIEAQRERFRVTLTSIGDGVITTDAQGRVTLLNAVAEELTGWSNLEAQGQPLTTVFAIVNEETRQPAGNPVARVLATGLIVGLANHSVLIARDGSQRPIDDSAAPIRDQQGNVVGVVLVFRDITEKKQAESAVLAATRQLKIVTESMSVPVTRCDRSLRYVWVNGPYAEWIRRKPEEIIGCSIEQVLGPEAFHRLLPHFQSVLAGKRVQYEEEVDFHGIGSRWINAVYTPTFDADKQVDGWVAVVTDLTERKRFEQALRDADRRKDQFIATLSHELRNPLAPIMNAVHLLQATGRTAQDADWALGVIERQLTQMARLLDDLLDVSRVSNNKLALRKVRISLSEVLHRAVETSQPLIDAAGHRLEVVLPEAPLWLDADPVRLAQVFSNLLNNAAKFTETSGQIRLQVEVQDQSVLVSVKDSGLGIPRERLTQVFEVFAQVEPALQRSHGGLGIGLSLVKGLVELHGGTVEARSEGPGAGSEFLVRIPLAGDTVAAPPGPLAQPGNAAGNSQLRILVVDDLRDSADSLAMMLRVMGHAVETAYDGEEALSVAAGFRPQVVFLDLGLPKRNGYEVAERLRLEPWGAETILIAVTGWGQEEDRRRAIHAGFDHHRTKPVSIDEITRLLADVVKQRAPQPQRSAAADAD